MLVPDPHVLVVVPLAVERHILGSVIAERHEVLPLRGLRLDADYVPELQTVLAAGGHGKAQFAVQTQYLISQFPGTRLVLCAGTAGRLHPGLSVGDVVIGRETVEHDFRKRIVPGPLPRFAADPDALSGICEREASRPRTFRVVVDVVASGDLDCVDFEHGCAIHAETGAACVAWEGAGAHRAAKFNGLGCLEMRAISDGGNHAAKQEFFMNLRQAMCNVSEILLDFLRGPKSAAH